MFIKNWNEMKCIEYVTYAFKMIKEGKNKTNQLSYLWKDVEELFWKLEIWRERRIYPALSQDNQIIEGKNL